MKLPETHAKIPKTKTIIAELPAAKPSSPSVRLAPLDTAETIKITIGINTIHVYLPKELSIQVIKSE